MPHAIQFDRAFCMQPGVGINAVQPPRLPGQHPPKRTTRPPMLVHCEESFGQEGAGACLVAASAFVPEVINPINSIPQFAQVAVTLPHQPVLVDDPLRGGGHVTHRIPRKAATASSTLRATT